MAITPPTVSLTTTGTDPKVASDADLNGMINDAFVDLVAQLGTAAEEDVTGILASPALTGVPTAPTAAPGTNTTQLATTAFVTAADVAERTATATLTGKTLNLTGNTLVATSAQIAAAVSDETGTGALVFAGSPALTGTPTAPTAAPGVNTTQVATTAFVTAADVAERTATATLTGKTLNLTSNTLVATSAQIAAAVSDETGTGALVFAGSPALTGTPTAPTAAPGVNTTQVATTAFVTAATVAERTATATLTGKTINLTSNTLVATSAQVAAAVSDETGTGALVFAGSPALTGTPTAPTAAPGTDTAQVATTAGIVAERTAPATLTGKTLNLTSNTLVATSAQIAAAVSDETGTGALVFAGSPALTGTPTAPTAAPGVNTTQVATTAFVTAADVAERTATTTLTGKTLNLTSNTLVATSAQIAAAVSDETGTGALVFAGSPALTGVPTAPTAAPGSDTTQIATTAHVQASVALVVDAQGYQDADSLFVFAAGPDGQEKVAGRVSADTAWHIALDTIRDVGGLSVYEFEVNGTASNAVIAVDANDLILWESGDASGGSEVIDARGTAATLGDRLAGALSPAGTTLAPLFGQEKLRRTHYKLTARKRSVAVQANIALVGDSFTHLHTRYSGGVAEMLIAEYGDGGGGWTGYGHRDTTTASWTIGSTQPTLRNGNARPSLYTMQLGGTWTRVSNLSDGPDLDQITSTEVGARVQRTVPATPDHTALRVVFIGTSNGVLRHRVDAGGWTTQNVQGTVGALQTFDIALTSGAHTIDIEVVSGTVTLCGDNSLSSASGVRLHKLGASGSRLNQWVARDAANQQAGWAMLALDAVTIMDGTNSQGNGVPPATWYSEMTTLVGRFRAACPGLDVGIIMPPENQRVGNAVAMTAYAAQGREAAVALNTAFMDLQSAFGADAADYAFGSANPLFAADLTHPDPATGGYLMQGEVMRLLKPF
jgi:hypothetical protein